VITIPLRSVATIRDLELKAEWIDLLKAEVRERLKAKGQQHRQFLKILIGTIIAFIGSEAISTKSNAIPGEKAQLSAVLHQWAQIDTFSPTETLNAFKRGVDYFNAEHYDSALDALPGDSEAGTTAIGDYILLYRAKSRLLLNQYKEALEDFRLLEKRHPNSSVIKDSLAGQCQALMALKDSKSVLALLGGHKMDANAENLYYQAKALDLEGDKNRALALYLQIYSEYPKSKQSPLAERGLLALSPGALKGARNYGNRLQRAENLLKANDNHDAYEILLSLRRVSAPDSMSSQRRNLLMAETEYRLGKPAEALTTLQKVTASDPAVHAKAIYLKGTCYRKLDKDQSMIALRDKALKLYPLSGDTEALCYLTATYYDVNHESAKGREAYRVLHRAFPKGPHSEIALWKLSLFSYFAGQYDEAELGFYKYLQTYTNPLAASSAMYWMGRCFEKLGDSGKAQYLYRRTQSLANNSYYGQRAHEAEAPLQRSGTGGNVALSGIDFKQVMSTCDGIRVQPVLMSGPDENGRQAIERARQLVAASLPELAVAELRWGIRRYPQNEDLLYFIMSRVYLKKGKYDGAIACLRKVIPDYIGRRTEELPEEVWRMLFPILHWDRISTQAAKAEIDPTLVLGVIRQESAFEEKARSKANARGLMQIMPATGRRLAVQAKVTRYNTDSLFHAETNIVLGIRFLASLLRQYGKTELALAAYNAGENRVDRWLREYGGGDMAEFVEQIPFSETRGYVKQVLSNKSHYDWLAPSAR
jgi:soluble lytic murein transglycosylase